MDLMAGITGFLKKHSNKISPKSLMYAKYIEYIEKNPVEENSVLLEANKGSRLEDNLRMLVREFGAGEEYKNFTVYLVCTPERIEERRDYLEWIGIRGIKLVPYETEEYFKVLATAKYLVNDGPFPGQFIKRQGQIYTRIWNGIAIKPYGCQRLSDYATIGHIQKNLFDADYLVCANEPVLHNVVKSYMLANFGQAEVIFAGRFQNEELLGQEYRKAIRKKYNLEDKQVFGFCPVLQNLKTIDGMNAATDSVKKVLQELEAHLTETQVVFVDLPDEIRSNLDLLQYTHIRPFPWEYRKYQVLSATDALITDEMELMLDYTVTGRKQLWFSLQGSSYSAEEKKILRELPYPELKSAEELIREMNSETSYDVTEFVQKYCSHSRLGVTKDVCHKVFLGENVPKLVMGKIPDNGKKNVLVYPGSLMKNGITASIFNLLEHADREKNNYMIIFHTDVLKKREEMLRELPAGVTYYGFYKYNSVSSDDLKLYVKWTRKKQFSYARAKDMLERRTEHEKNRLMDSLRIDSVIHYDGYAQGLMMLFGKMSCKRIIYVHNDMIKEITQKKSVRKEILSKAYQEYDCVALVSEEQREKTERIASYQKEKGLSGKANIVVAKNVINYKHVLELSEKPFIIDSETEMNVSEEKLRKMLSSNGKVFVTIGRFSKEKGHVRLIEAFEKVHEEHKDTGLIILGGYGPLYQETVARAEQSTAKDAIVIIKYLSNPYALLKKCNYFVLSSFYEGLPVVITEADLVGLPCFSTDIPGPHNFMSKYGGMLVENNLEGIVTGMKKCLSNEVPEKLLLDYEQYSREAVEDFEAML